MDGYIIVVSRELVIGVAIITPISAAIGFYLGWQRQKKREKEWLKSLEI